MRQWNYYVVSFQGSVRFETLNKDEAENYARSLFARSESDTPPTIDECSRSSDK